MSEWISVEEQLPEFANKGVQDAFPVLALVGVPGGKINQWNIRVCTWMNNRFEGFPSGATVVLYWMHLPEPPK